MLLDRTPTFTLKARKRLLQSHIEKACSSVLQKEESRRLLVCCPVLVSPPNPVGATSALTGRRALIDFFLFFPSQLYSFNCSRCRLPEGEETNARVTAFRRFTAIRTNQLVVRARAAVRACVCAVRTDTTCVMRRLGRLSALPGPPSITAGTRKKKEKGNKESAPCSCATTTTIATGSQKASAENHAAVSAGCLSLFFAYIYIRTVLLHAAPVRRGPDSRTSPRCPIRRRNRTPHGSRSLPIPSPSLSPHFPLSLSLRPQLQNSSRIDHFPRSSVVCVTLYSGGLRLSLTHAQTRAPTRRWGLPHEDVLYMQPRLRCAFLFAVESVVSGCCCCCYIRTRAGNAPSVIA